MSSFGFLLHSERPLAAELGAELADWLSQRGHDVRFTIADAERVGRPGDGEPIDELGVGLDLMVGVGGDGTMLDAVTIAAPHDVPVLGVNVGQLGYLTTVEPAMARSSLKRFLAGAYVIEERMRIATVLHREGSPPEDVPAALNEVLLERAELGHTVRIDVALDGRPWTPYVADGVLLATPTGSTAYAFSVRGPILDPRHRAQVLVPVSPHMLFDRAMVLVAETEVRLTVAGARPAHLSIDGHSGGILAPGEAIVCAAAEVPARLVRFGPPAFHAVLKDKFSLSDR